MKHSYSSKKSHLLTVVVVVFIIITKNIRTLLNMTPIAYLISTLSPVHKVALYGQRDTLNKNRKQFMSVLFFVFWKASK